jgi:hypothetical protein
MFCEEEYRHSFIFPGSLCKCSLALSIGNCYECHDSSKSEFFQLSSKIGKHSNGKKMLAISVNHVLKTLTIPDILKNINVYIMKRDPMTVNNVIKP